MTEIDHEGLKAWYRNAMRERVAQLEAIRSALACEEPGARHSIHVLGQELRGSGGSFGFPEISEVGALLEEGPDAFLSRHIEGALALLRNVAWPDEPHRHERNGWLAVAAAVKVPTMSSRLEEAWAQVATTAGIDEDALAVRVAEYFSLEVAQLEGSEAGAMRLVPPATCAEWGVLPLAEDDIHIRIATADPTDLVAEAVLQRLTGRIPLFEVAPPGRVREALTRMRDPAAPATSPPPPHPDPGGTVTILVVDDDPGSRLMAAAVLKRKGFGVLEAGDGAAALELVAAETNIALVVADLEMPTMTGLELLQRLKATEATAHLPVVVLTGSEDPVTEASLIEEGADDYIRKPLDPRLFVARVRATLRRVGGWRSRTGAHPGAPPETS